MAQNNYKSPLTLIDISSSLQPEHKKRYPLPTTHYLLQAETSRLHSHLKNLGWTESDCAVIAPMTLEINRLKKEQNTIILAHSYQSPDIMYGVADVIGDSYGLSKIAQETKADTIIFCSVLFMGETAKILNPTKRVLVPSRAGCSLADSITAAAVRELKQQHPGAPVVCYVNTSAEVKAESDIACTSSNVYQIVKNLPNNKIIFIPDELMAANLVASLRDSPPLEEGTPLSGATCLPAGRRSNPVAPASLRDSPPLEEGTPLSGATKQSRSPASLRGVAATKQSLCNKESTKQIITWPGRCIVHEQFTPESVEAIRKQFPGVKILAHPECKPEVTAKADFVGSTTAMLNYIKSDSPSTGYELRVTSPYMIISECGLTDRIKSENPEEKIVGTCVMCPYMKQIQLKDVLKALKDPTPDQLVEIPADVLNKAKKTFDEMYKWEIPMGEVK